MSSRRLVPRLQDAALQRVTNLLGHRRLRLAGVEVSPAAKLMGLPIISRCAGSQIVIEDEVVLCSWSRWTALGVSHAVVIRTLTAAASLRIGRGTGISGGSFCAAVSVDIGERCFIGADVVIVDTDFHSLADADRRTGDDWGKIQSAAVHIGDGVFIGARSTVLKGVRIGEGAVIGAGSVVTRSVPARHVAAGNPAVVVRAL